MNGNMIQKQAVADASAQAAGGLSELAGKRLIFKLSEEEYGIEIMKVKEIIGLMEITNVPQMPEYIRGVINLRGNVIPVVDLRSRFGMTPTEDTDETCIIVVDAAQNGESSLTGILVDTVSEVLEIAANQIEETPSFGASLNTGFIMGMARVGDEVKILLDIIKVLE